MLALCHEALHLSEGSPATVPNASFDFIGLLSVPHHIPDWLHDGDHVS